MDGCLNHSKLQAESVAPFKWKVSLSFNFSPWSGRKICCGCKKIEVTPRPGLENTMVFPIPATVPTPILSTVVEIELSIIDKGLSCLDTQH